MQQYGLKLVSNPYRPDSSKVVFSQSPTVDHTPWSFWACRNQCRQLEPFTAFVFQLQELTATIGFAVAIFGYNQAGGGSVLPDASFNKQFPKMDVIYTTGAQQHYNATIQGMSFPTSKYQTNLLIHTRHRNRPLHADRRVRRPRLYLRVRYMGPARHDLRRCRDQLRWRIVDVYLFLLWTIHRLTYNPRHRHRRHHRHCQRLAK